MTLNGNKRNMKWHWITLLSLSSDAKDTSNKKGNLKKKGVHGLPPKAPIRRTCQQRQKGFQSLPPKEPIGLACQQRLEGIPVYAQASVDEWRFRLIRDNWAPKSWECQWQRHLCISGKSEQSGTLRWGSCQEGGNQQITLSKIDKQWQQRGCTLHASWSCSLQHIGLQNRAYRIPIDNPVQSWKLSQHDPN